MRSESLVLLSMAGLTGVVFLFTRGVWSAAPLLVIGGVGFTFHLLRPVPKDRPGRIFWANANLAAVVVALASTWLQSWPGLVVGLLLVLVTLVVPRLQHPS